MPVAALPLVEEPDCCLCLHVFAHDTLAFYCSRCARVRPTYLLIMSLDSAFGEVSPHMWTIRLKSKKTTVLLHVMPTEDFDNIKKSLLAVLHEIYPDGRLNEQPIPNDASKVIFAKPVDIFDYTKGWASLEDSLSFADADDTKSKKKTKSSSTPKDAGLKDSAVLAFKFRSTPEDEDEGLGLEEQWDVVIPDFEDSTGTTNVGDVGGVHSEFRG